MLTLDLWKKHFPHKSFDFIGEKISDGADGEVFFLKEDSSKVIKVSALFDLDLNQSLNDKYANIKMSLDCLQGHNTIFAKVFRHNKIGKFTRDFLGFKQEYILHYCIMEKCFKLTEDEKKVFHSIISHEDRGLIKKFSGTKFDEILFGLSRGLDFDSKKIRLFYELLMASSIKHLDLHPRNIMKDKNGNFKLIDFDRLQMETI